MVFGSAGIMFRTECKLDKVAIMLTWHFFSSFVGGKNNPGISQYNNSGNIDTPIYVGRETA